MLCIKYSENHNGYSNIVIYYTYLTVQKRVYRYDTLFFILIYLSSDMFALKSSPTSSLDLIILYRCLMSLLFFIILN